MPNDKQGTFGLVNSISRFVTSSRLRKESKPHLLRTSPPSLGRDTLGLGTPGRLWGWAGEILGLGTPKILWGWALQGDAETRHSGNPIQETLGWALQGGTGTLCGWALQAGSRLWGWVLRDTLRLVNPGRLWVGHSVDSGVGHSRDSLQLGIPGTLWLGTPGMSEE